MNPLDYRYVRNISTLKRIINNNNFYLPRTKGLIQLKLMQYYKVGILLQEMILM